MPRHHDRDESCAILFSLFHYYYLRCGARFLSFVLSSPVIVVRTHTTTTTTIVTTSIGTAYLSNRRGERRCVVCVQSRSSTESERERENNGKTAVRRRTTHECMEVITASTPTRTSSLSLSLPWTNDDSFVESTYARRVLGSIIFALLIASASAERDKYTSARIQIAIDTPDNVGNVPRRDSKQRR